MFLYRGLKHVTSSKRLIEAGGAERALCLAALNAARYRAYWGYESLL